MAKKIVQINTSSLGDIKVGSHQWNLEGEPLVGSIEFSDEYGTHFVLFEGITKFLEVFDVNYVIRDEE